MKSTVSSGGTREAPRTARRPDLQEIFCSVACICHLEFVFVWDLCRCACRILLSVTLRCSQPASQPGSTTSRWGKSRDSPNTRVAVLTSSCCAMQAVVTMACRYVTVLVADSLSLRIPVASLLPADQNGFRDRIVTVHCRLCVYVCMCAAAMQLD